MFIFFFYLFGIMNSSFCMVLFWYLLCVPYLYPPPHHPLTHAHTLAGFLWKPLRPPLCWAGSDGAGRLSTGEPGGPQREGRA